MPAANNSLKIGIILDTSFDINDGVQQYVMSIGEWLRSQGHDVHYLVGETHERDLPNIHSLSRNFNVTFNGNKMTIPVQGNKAQIKALLSKERFDVLHVQTPHHPLLAQRIIRYAPKTTAVVGTFHILPYGTVARHANKVLGKLLKPSLRRIDTMLAVSPAAAEFEEWSFGNKATVLPNVFDYKRFQTAQPFEKYDDDVLTVLFFGRLVERKGCMQLLRAIRALDRDTLPKFRVVICGKGERMSQLQQYVQDNGLGDIVEFTGYVSEEDKPRYYASADIAVFPSISGESFGIVLLEAMASGRAAVLAGNNPGYASVMHPKPELLFDPMDIDQLATQLRSLLTDSALRAAAAEWGTEYTKEFDVHVVGPKLMTIYNEIIAKKQADEHNTPQEGANNEF